MTADPTTQLGDGVLAEALFESICVLYDQVFSQPPFLWGSEESSGHRALLGRLKNEPSFGIATAQIAEQLVGFAYGYQLHPSTAWWQNYLKPLPDEMTQEWPGRTFALTNLAVKTTWRGQGRGRKLIEILLANRTEERATLLVQPTAIETQAFYEHLGWQKVGRRQMRPSAVSPQYDVYVLELRTSRT
jgi:ribosomal protein S18 acetylase RimI-like enzyme